MTGYARRYADELRGIADGAEVVRLAPPRAQQEQGHFACNTLNHDDDTLHIKHYI